MNPSQHQQQYHYRIIRWIKKSLKIYFQNKQKRSPQPQAQIQPEPESEPQLEEQQETKEFNSVQDMAFAFLLPEMFGLLIDKLIKKGNDLSVDEIILLINTE
eukprot:39495_1